MPDSGMKKHSAPRVKLASVNECFQAVEGAIQKGKGEIQTIIGEMPCWWDGTQSVENDAFMLTRHAEYLLTTAEKFSAINDLLLHDYDYPQAAINNAWKGKLWVHEHNWGGRNSIISDAVKLAHARDTYRLSEDLVSHTLGTFIQHIRCSNRGIPLVVFNSLTWERSDIVDYEVSVEKRGINELCLVDGKGNSVPSQIKTISTYSDGSIARAQVIFEVQVPSLGYVTYFLVTGKKQDCHLTDILAHDAEKPVL